MATLTTQKVTRAGLVNPTFGACAGGGDRFTPDNNTHLHVKNGSGGALTVTVAATKVPLANMTVANVVVSVPAGGEARLGPFPYDMFAATDGSGLADITYSGVTSLTIAVIQVPEP
jgi:hypothetical protein